MYLGHVLGSRVSSYSQYAFSAYTPRIMYNMYEFLVINIQCDEKKEDATSHDVT